MITREEYNKALDVVEAYHKQLFVYSVRTSPYKKDNDPNLLNAVPGGKIKCINKTYNTINLTIGKVYDILETEPIFYRDSDELKSVRVRIKNDKGLSFWIRNNYNKWELVDSVGGSLRYLSKTPFLKWDKFNKCSTRLKGVLRLAEYYNEKYDYNYFIETIDWSQFKKIRNAGKKSWEEFVRLRGY